ncbi:SDR family NAD(P)-dependent oxidoreductase [Candidatus Methylospira mobilis]|uniref:SDR family NAD(P)-dependent oxidoreductase n=1 Tax=Candidatus Methylospira mobilis TaxID=1808979 RepID=UPI001D17A53A|nr:SDR family NAD(P)-dependent oxidoreductase [Candidatus Methylospira mobilis]
MSNIKNPVCVIVGAGPGNGAALAKKFAGEGFEVALLARNRERLSELAAALPRAQAYACDVIDTASVSSAFNAIARDMGAVDTVIYNAGKGILGDALSVCIDDFESAWRVNALGAFVVAQQVLPAMRQADKGTILFMGATASRRGGAKTAAFAPAKAAQRIFAESLARAYGPDGTHVGLIIIDAVVDEPYARSQFPDREDSFFCKPADIADSAFMLAKQLPSAWTFELELRPSGERW